MKVTKIVSHSSDGSMLSVYVEHQCSKEIEVTLRKQVSDKGDVAFLNKFKDGSYSFGIIQGDYKSMGHSGGYIWSSRASVMNQIFGTHIVEAAVRLPGNTCYISRAFDIDDIEAALPEDWRYIEKAYSNGETYNQLVYLGKEPIKYQCGKRLYSAEGESGDNVLHLNTILQEETI